MDSSTLRVLQAPLKERYRADPDAALTPLGAVATFEPGSVTCLVEGFAGPVRAGLHEATGGDGTDACSGDMLLQAVLACAGVTLRSVATTMGIDVSGATLRAQAVFDARGTLGVDRDAPVGIQDLVITVDLPGDLTQETLDRLARATEKYCVVAQSLREAPRIVLRRSA